MKFKVWPFRFNTKKAVQAVAVLLRHVDPMGKRDDYTRILKLLYLAEKECFAQRGRPLLGDEVFAMQNGPVLSAVYDLIQNRHCDSSEWNKFVVQDRFDIVLKGEPDNDLLSPFEIKLLEHVADKYANKNQWQLIAICHELPEWIAHKPEKDNGPQAIPIPIEEILDTIPAPGLKDRVLAWAAEQAAFEQLLPQSSEA